MEWWNTRDVYVMVRSSNQEQKTQIKIWREKYRRKIGWGEIKIVRTTDRFVRFRVWNESKRTCRSVFFSSLCFLIFAFSIFLANQTEAESEKNVVGACAWRGSYLYTIPPQDRRLSTLVSARHDVVLDTLKSNVWRGSFGFHLVDL